MGCLYCSDICQRPRKLLETHLKTGRKCGKGVSEREGFLETLLSTQTHLHMPRKGPTARKSLLTSLSGCSLWCYCYIEKLGVLVKLDMSHHAEIRSPRANVKRRPAECRRRAEREADPSHLEGCLGGRGPRIGRRINTGQVEAAWRRRARSEPRMLKASALKAEGRTKLPFWGDGAMV